MDRMTGSATAPAGGTTRAIPTTTTTTITNHYARRDAWQPRK
jgi:hypothetical protein